MRIAFSIVPTKTLPSPILPVFAALIIARLQRLRLSESTTSIFILGENQRYHCPGKFPCDLSGGKTLYSLTVIPSTPTSASASFTSSSLKGLMIASIFSSRLFSGAGY
jgi:hypothetical protein